MNSILQANYTNFCFLDDVSVFLDRKNDRYHYVGQQQSEALSRLEKINVNEKYTRPGINEYPEEVINDLISKNLLTTQQSAGTPIRQTVHDKPISSVYDTFWSRNFSPKIITIMAAHYVLTRRHLKRETFFETTRKAEKLKLKLKRHAIFRSNDVITEISRKLIDSRYFIYTYKDKCFFDSYLFFTYFNGISTPVEWVFGVNLCPFSAHCWVEYNGIVLNDQFERVSAFTPIYII